MRISKNSFIYIWRDKKYRKYYIGSHSGREDDGYICSSASMIKEYQLRSDDFKRRILARFKNITQDELLSEEQKWLDYIKEKELGVKYYNMRKSATSWVWSEQRRVEHSQKMVGNKCGLGKPCSQEKREKIARAQKNKFIPLESREKMRLAKIGTKQSAETIEKRASKLRGKKRPETGEKKRLAKLGKSRPDMIGNKYAAGRVPWNKGMRYKRKPKQEKIEVLNNDS